MLFIGRDHRRSVAKALRPVRSGCEEIGLRGEVHLKMFAQHMVKDHQKDIGYYQKAAKKLDAAGQYAQGTLPTLQKHLENARALQKQKTSALRRGVQSKRKP